MIAECPMCAAEVTAHRYKSRDWAIECSDCYFVMRPYANPNDVQADISFYISGAEAELWILEKTVYLYFSQDLSQIYRDVEFKSFDELSSFCAEKARILEESKIFL
jgi:hypothetical protein